MKYTYMLFSAQPVVRMTRQTLFIEDVDKMFFFVRCGHLKDPLLNVDVGTADPADSHKDVLIQHVAGELLDFLRKRCTEHQRLTIILRWHSHLIHQLRYVRKKSHVEHPVCFIED